MCSRPFRPVGFPIYVARCPAAPFTRSYPRHFTFYVAEPITSIRMSPLLIKISKDFATLFTTIDPIGNVALFAGLTASLTRAERRRTALRASIYAAIILVVAVVAVQIILDAIGIHLHSLKVAGGIILFLFGLQMLFGKMDEKTGRSPEAGGALPGVPPGGPFHAWAGAAMAGGPPNRYYGRPADESGRNGRWPP